MDFWATFWAIVWYAFLAFTFVGALMALFSVIADLVRDRELAGGYKALWAFFLVFVPFITVLVYLIARGRGMAERSAEASEQSQHATEAYIRSVAASSPAEEIEKAQSLLETGAITSAEFAAIKAHALVGVRPTATAGVV